MFQKKTFRGLRFVLIANKNTHTFFRDVYRLHRKELDAIVDSKERLRRLTELNVVEQTFNLWKTGVVQERREETALVYVLHPTTEKKLHIYCAACPRSAQRLQMKLIRLHLVTKTSQIT